MHHIASVGIVMCGVGVCDCVQLCGRVACVDAVVEPCTQVVKHQRFVDAQVVFEYAWSHVTSRCSQHAAAWS